MNRCLDLSPTLQFVEKFHQVLGLVDAERDAISSREAMSAEIHRNAEPSPFREMESPGDESLVVESVAVQKEDCSPTGQGSGARMSWEPIDGTRLSSDDYVGHHHPGTVNSGGDETVGEVHPGISHRCMLDWDDVGDGVGEAEVHPGFRVDEGGEPPGGLEELVGHYLAWGATGDEQGNERGEEGKGGDVDGL